MITPKQLRGKSLEEICEMVEGLATPERPLFE